MADFNYNASGSLIAGSSVGVIPRYLYSAGGNAHLSRCGTIVFFYPRRVVYIKFNAGDIAYLRHRAIKGIIEAVWIKEVRAVGWWSAIYFDNLNAVFNEEDLLTHAEAISVATAYLEAQILKAQKALECL